MLIHELLLLLFLHRIGLSDLVSLLSSDHSIFLGLARAFCGLLLLFLMLSVADDVVRRGLLLPLDGLHVLKLFLVQLPLLVLQSVLLVEDLGLILHVLLVLLGHEPPDYVLILLLGLQEPQQQPLPLIVGQMSEVNLLLLHAARGLALLRNCIEHI